MPDVKQRMIDIVNSVPDDYFDGLKPTEMVFKLMVEYIKRYGEDETTIIPGTDKHFNYENFKEIFENKNQGIELLKSLQINENIRPEELTLENFAEIAKLTISSTIKVTGTLVFTAPDGDSPQTDKFDIELVKLADEADLTELQTAITNAEAILNAADKDKYSAAALVELQELVNAGKQLTT